MPRVVVKRTDKTLQDASEACPAGCFRKVGDEFVIDPTQCIDCGVCQTIVDAGVVVEDTQATEEDKKYNEEKSK